MSRDEAALSELAGAILDGTPIDWDAADSGAAPADRPIVRQLKAIAALAGAQRTEMPDMWGPLRLLERIGHGAFGDVYRAWDSRLDREVALKLLPDDQASSNQLATSIIEEGRLLARIRHPNVVTIYGAERIDSRVGLWMEYVDGRTLHQLVVEDGRRFTPTDVAGIGEALCGAVAAVHAASFLHRDIKAQNVMMARDGRVALMDFGTGREQREGSDAVLAGTPLYLAPEVLTGAMEPTVQADIYSVGVLLFFLLAGSYPVTGGDLAALRAAHERHERRSLNAVRPDVPRRLRGVIERAIDPRPERRHESADALGADLAALKGYSRVARLAYPVGVAAAIILVVGVGWEVAGRQVGSSRTPSAVLAGFAGLNSVGGVIVSPAERPMIAVLPLKNLSAEADSDYFVDGLTDEIIRNLAVIEGLEVRSRTSSFAFKDKTRNLRDIGEQLGVNLIVEGSIMRSGSRLRINAQLVQVAGDVPLWAERFDRELEDIFAIQDEISRAIVNKLRLRLGRGQRRYQTNLEAYELYLTARAVVARRDIPSAQKAAELFEQVIARDPAFAPAYAGLVDAYASMSMGIQDQFMPNAMRPETALALMAPAAEAALQLDPLLAEAHAAMGVLNARKLDWQKAEESFRRAIDLNPSLTHIYASYSTSTLIPLGKLAVAEQHLRRALQSDPLSLSLQRELAWVQFVAGRYEEAIDGLEHIRAVDPHFSTVDIRLARALTFAGRPLEALRVLETRRAEPGVQHWMAHAYVLVGRRAEVERLAAAHDQPFRLAVIYAALGDTDRAFEALDRAAVTVPHRVGNLLRDPEMAALRGDPRFDAVRKKLGLP